jgi:hypothetical protein
MAASFQFANLNAFNAFTMPVQSAGSHLSVTEQTVPASNNLSFQSQTPASNPHISAVHKIYDKPGHPLQALMKNPDAIATPFQLGFLMGELAIQTDMIETQGKALEDMRQGIVPASGQQVQMAEQLLEAMKHTTTEVTARILQAQPQGPDAAMLENPEFMQGASMVNQEVMKQLAASPDSRINQDLEKMGVFNTIYASPQHPMQALQNPTLVPNATQQGFMMADVMAMKENLNKAQNYIGAAERGEQPVHDVARMKHALELVQSLPQLIAQLEERVNIGATQQTVETPRDFMMFHYGVTLQDAYTKHAGVQ